MKIFQRDFKDYFVDDEFEKDLCRQMENVDVVFNFNFLPIIARSCYLKNKKYISWCFDCPLFQLFSKETRYKTNAIFVFDLEQLQECKRVGIDNIHYLPLAANIECDELDGDVQYQCDVSFIGRLYENNLYRQIDYLPEYLKGFFDGIMSA